jgi:two-component system, NarL family, response regulator NreC
MARGVSAQPQTAGPIRLLVVDDHTLFRRALRAVLETQEGLEVVGEATTGRDAVAAAEELRPDVVLMDMAMPGLTGIESTRRITSRVSGARVLILSAYADEARIREVVTAGAAGYAVKSSELTELLVAIWTVARGNAYFSPSVADEVAARDLAARHAVGAHESVTSDELTSREREILQLLGEGHSSSEIADALVLSPKTVESHRTHIIAKLRARNHTDLVRHAVRLGLIELERPELEA